MEYWIVIQFRSRFRIDKLGFVEISKARNKNLTRYLLFQISFRFNTFSVNIRLQIGATIINLLIISYLMNMNLINFSKIQGTNLYPCFRFQFRTQNLNFTLPPTLPAVLATLLAAAPSLLHRPQSPAALRKPPAPTFPTRLWSVEPRKVVRKGKRKGEAGTWFYTDFNRIIEENWNWFLDRRARVLGRGFRGEIRKGQGLTPTHTVTHRPLSLIIINREFLWMSQIKTWGRI